MKYAFVLAAIAAFAVSPALAGGRGGSLAGGSLLGGVLAPVTAAVSGVQVNALNNVSVLSGSPIANGNKIGVVAPVKAIVSKNGLVGGLLGGLGLGHGCGCN
ncbi:hypothetical protein [Bosea sp. (in: a-proteobacteria)]|uniref:hypothetical protein n=1 Tax=Bosea sp. (in: a-proteobacteria) TaxID=1871050 RepID=UPI00333FC024